MSQHVEAIFENGVFRPLGPVEVDDRALVRLVIDASATDEHQPEGGETALIAQQRAALAELREQMNALPTNSPADGFSGSDHDRLLYGAP
jgi:predicted DNA-binding antitoxin AbrB/MazE fold protein